MNGSNELENGSSEPEPAELEPAIPLRSVTKAPVERLVLDLQNPRLLSITEKGGEEAIIAQLYRSEDLSELLASIAANGYLDIEPLIVLGEHAPLTVLEGNRRLAAIRLFEDPKIVDRVFKQEEIRITVPAISEQARSTIHEVSVYRVQTREEARPFIGFKHINGAARWESYAKGRFAAQWYESGDVTLTEIADRIGDKHDTIKRMVNAIYVLEQARDKGIYNISDRTSPKFNFSHLYTALSRETYMQFLGLEQGWSRFDPQRDPVSEDKLQNLRDVLRWIYGSTEHDSLPVVRSQNPDIRLLGEVLANPEALTVLRSNSSLDEAHENTSSANQRFSEALVVARRQVQRASNNLRGFDGTESSLVGIAEDISETAQAMHARMVSKVQEVRGSKSIKP